MSFHVCVCFKNMFLRRNPPIVSVRDGSLSTLHVCASAMQPETGGTKVGAPVCLLLKSQQFSRAKGFSTLWQTMSKMMLEPWQISIPHSSPPGMGNQEELFSFGIEVLVYESRFSDLLRLSKGSFLGELTGISKRSLNEESGHLVWTLGLHYSSSCTKENVVPTGSPRFLICAVESEMSSDIEWECWAQCLAHSWHPVMLISFLPCLLSSCLYIAHACKSWMQKKKLEPRETWQSQFEEFFFEVVLFFEWIHIQEKIHVHFC